MRLTTAVLCLLALVAFAGSASANMITNGGFDDNGGSLDGWTQGVEGGNGSVVAKTAQNLMTGPQGGTHFAAHFNNDPSYIYQTFTTVSGTTYDISFYLARANTKSGFAVDIDVFSGAGDPGGSGFDGDLLDMNIGHGDVGTDPTWVLFESQFTATSTESTFRSRDPGSSGIDAGIDTVSIVPEPASMTLLALGGLGALVRRRRRA